MTDQLAAWQKGVPIERLRPLAALFRDSDSGYVHGAFTPWKENTVAALIDSGEMCTRGADDAPRVAAAIRHLTRLQPYTDFTRAKRVTLKPGDVYVSRAAYRDPEEAAALIREETQGRRVWLQTWAEKPADRELARLLGLRPAASKIPSSSEIITLYGSGLVLPAPYPAHDRVAICRVVEAVPPVDVDALYERLDQLGYPFAQHYSQFNKGGSWQALALRGFSDDPRFISKPTEMSKKWKEENAEKLAWTVRDTPLRSALGDVLEPLIGLVPGRPERIRLMLLEPAGGELERHADIVDPDCGTRDNENVRIHLPLRTNPSVVFTAWNLDGIGEQHHMACGEGWYLDTRKPHRAVNDGSEPRLHLVIDTSSSPQMRAALR